MIDRANIREDEAPTLKIPAEARALALTMVSDKERVDAWEIEIEIDDDDVHVVDTVVPPPIARRTG